MNQKAAARRWAREAETSHLQCRVGRGGHRWPDLTELNPNEAIKFVPAKRATATREAVPGCYQLVITCQRCEATTTTTIIKHNGQLGRSGRPKYPEGYKFESGDGTPMDREAKGIARQELLRRFLEGDL